jgi:ribonuclease HII
VKVLVDGNRLPTIDVLAEAVIGGDARIKSISAASILAKVHRDRLCRELDEEFPHYGFARTRAMARRSTWRRCACTAPAGHHRRFFAPVAATFMTPDGQAIELRVS